MTTRRKDTPRRKPGRPSKYSEAAAEKVCQYIVAGLSRERAAALVGISATTLYAWGEQKPEFVEAIKKADAAFVARQVAGLEAAAREHPRHAWQARAWLLERKHPAEYSPVRRDVVLTADVGAGGLPPNYVAAVGRALGIDPGVGEAIEAAPLPAEQPRRVLDSFEPEPLEMESDPLPEPRPLPPSLPPSAPPSRPGGLITGSAPSRTFPLGGGVPGERGR